MYGIAAEIVEFTGSDEEAVERMRAGEMDAFITITLEAYADDPDSVVPVCKIGTSDFYFVVNKDRPDLLAELDSAMNRIQDENQYYNQQLFEKYLRYSSANRLICTVFRHSPVFRIGGDEFAAVLMNSDFENRGTLVEQFAGSEREICAAAQNEWEKVSVALGIAVYDPAVDHSVNDTARRADKVMYQNKHLGRKYPENAGA